VLWVRLAGLPARVLAGLEGRTRSRSS